MSYIVIQVNTESPDMPTTTFSTRIDADLKQRLEQIAQYEDRSASYLANQAIRALVEEREATHALVRTGSTTDAFRPPL